MHAQSQDIVSFLVLCHNCCYTACGETGHGRSPNVSALNYLRIEVFTRGALIGDQTANLFVHLQLYIHLHVHVPTRALYQDMCKIIVETIAGSCTCTRAGGRFSILIGSAGCQRALARQLGGSGGMPPLDFETF